MIEIQAGQVFETNEGGSCTVIAYKNASHVEIKFNDNYGLLAVVRTGDLRRGKVKNPYHRSVYGVGFIGTGSFKRSVKGRLTREYRVWSGMLARCYRDGTKQRNPTYVDCTVHKDWHNFQNFAKWITSQDHCDSNYELDKDLLVKGNKLYSDKTCCLVPACVNLLIHTSQKKISDLPVGVVMKPNGRFRAYMIKYGSQKYLGTYDTAEEASEVYVNHKEDYVKRIAREWQDKISADAFDALLTWTVY